MRKKIAVLRANALGDFIFVLPALRAIKETYPDSEIVYLGKAWHKEYLENRNTPVDRVIIVPPYPGVGETEGYKPDPKVLDKFFAEMLQEEFDLALQLHGGGKNSNPFVLRLGAKLTVGLKTPDAVSLDINVPYVYYFSETLRYLEVVSYIGAKTSYIEPEVEVTRQDIDEARRVIGQSWGKPVAVIHPGASDLRRRWPEENFAQIADELVTKGFKVYLTGIPEESLLLERVYELGQNKSEIINLCNKLSIGGMTGLLSMADLLITNDTGPLHLARAIKIPTVGVYWCGNAITGLPMTTSLHRSIPSFKANCPLCGLSSKKFGKSDHGECNHETSFVTDVSVIEVKNALHELLNQNQKEERITLQIKVA